MVKLKFSLAILTAISSAAIIPTQVDKSEDGLNTAQTPGNDTEIITRYLGELDNVNSDLLANDVSPVVCFGDLISKEDAFKAEKGLAKLCGDGLLIPPIITFYHESAYAFIKRHKDDWKVECTKESVEASFEEIKSKCGKERKGIVVSPTLATYGILNKDDH